MSIQTEAHTKVLSRVRALVERGERVPGEDVASLVRVTDTNALARIARIPRERRYGRSAFFTDAHVVEYRGESADEIAAGIGGSHVSILLRPEGPRIDPERLPEAARALAGRYDVALATSAARVDHVARTIGIAHVDVLRQLQTGAPVVVTGDDAELFDEALRSTLAPAAPSAETWLAVHRAAHDVGARSVASMRYLTSERPEAYAAHLDAIRTLQDETGGFVSFVPLPAHDYAIEASYLAAPTAHQSLRAIAIARIALDNIEHIAAAPALVTDEVAYVALSYGADTIDTTIAPKGRSFELPVIGEAASMAPRFDRDVVVSRIVEARFAPVALDAAMMIRSTEIVTER
jgi:aminodeoxyfutalosine synthase